MNYNTLIKKLSVVRGKQDIKSYLNDEQRLLLQKYEEKISDEEDIAEQLIELIRWTKLPFEVNFFQGIQQKDRKMIEEKMKEELVLKEIYHLSSIVWSISKGELCRTILILSDESKENAVKQFSFLLSIIALLNKESAVFIYEAIIQYKELLMRFYENKENVIETMLPEYKKNFIERCYFLVGTLWFGGDSFEHINSEYLKKLPFGENRYQQIQEHYIRENVISIRENGIIKLNKKGINHIKLALINLLSFWTLNLFFVSKDNYILPHKEFFENWFEKELKKNVKIKKRITSEGKEEQKKQKRTTYKKRITSYEYTLWFWSNIFNSLYKNPKLKLDTMYEEVKLFLFRYSISPLYKEIVMKTDSDDYRKLVSLFENLNLIKKVNCYGHEIILLSKDLLRWLNEDKDNSR